MKITIQSFNNEWQYTFEDADEDVVESGFRGTFTACAGRCLELVCAEKQDTKQAMEAKK
jgi:hypothetical protein